MARDHDQYEVVSNKAIQQNQVELNDINNGIELKDADIYTPASVDIEFSNLTYKVQGGKKTILHGVSGQFRAGQLSVILGTSGAGKSSLMDILIGHRNAGVTGDIQVHGVTSLRKSSCYIQQEEKLQPFLSVIEAMNIAAQLKLGATPCIRYRVVHGILDTLGMTECSNTRVEKLSGGQRKRLSIALELLSNPPVIFLDEPTTGLDVVSVSQCMQLLRSLALQGRTIVCTIHQPSASLFSLFHHVYVLAEGCCTYQGSADQLIPFLASVDLPCPPYHNPADYVIEVTQCSKDSISRLSDAIQNGERSLPDVKYFSKDNSDAKCSANEFPISIVSQTNILVRRMLLQQSRNKVALLIQFLHHLLSGIMVGGIYFNCGQAAEKSFLSVQFCMTVMVFYTYTHVMGPVMLFPGELEILKREYYNRWYSLKSYFFAMFIASLPGQLIFGPIFLAIAYPMANQPFEVHRILYFATVCLLMCLISDCLGYIIGAMFNITMGAIACPAICSPMFVVSIYGMGYGPVLSNVMKFVMSLSYFRSCFTGMVLAVFGMDRESLVCNELYCHFRHPNTVLYNIGMNDVSIQSRLIVLCIFFIFYRIFFYLVLKIRLTRDFKSKIINFWNIKLLCRKI